VAAQLRAAGPRGTTAHDRLPCRRRGALQGRAQLGRDAAGASRPASALPQLLLWVVWRVVLRVLLLLLWVERLLIGVLALPPASHRLPMLKLRQLSCAGGGSCTRPLLPRISCARVPGRRSCTRLGRHTHLACSSCCTSTACRRCRRTRHDSRHAGRIVIALRSCMLLSIRLRWPLRLLLMLGLLLW
jgi:hypothetical protein